jgi:hypothetical protein
MMYPQYNLKNNFKKCQKKKYKGDYWGLVIQVEECLLNKCEVLNSSSSSTKKLK